MSLFLIVLVGCAFKQDKPPANLKFAKIERVGETALYDLYFSSDVDIKGTYKSLIGIGLLCALEDDEDFNENHKMRYFMDGGVRRDTSGARFDFISRMVFSEKIANGSSERDLSPVEVEQILAKKDHVSCRFFASATMIDTYFSNVMYVPVESVIRAMGAPPAPRR
ncbi:hypothetical protein ACOI9X_01115 [Pseudomonas sp. P2757]|uniref:hypothetical protein n=1 Tax=unclassified Pseudomonas TaxID=196821 RepID=UPI003B5A8269